MWHSYISVLVTRWFTQVSFQLPHWIEVRDDIPGAVLQYENRRPSHWGVEEMQRATHLPVCSSLSWETSLFQDSWIFLRGPEQNSIFNLLLLFYSTFYLLCVICAAVDTPGLKAQIHKIWPNFLTNWSPETATSTVIKSLCHKISTGL